MKQAVKSLKALSLVAHFYGTDRDLFGKGLYPSTNRGTFLYILSETDTYGRLKGLVAVGASENGSDGTIRAASASLDSSVKLEVNFIDPAHPQVNIITQSPVFKLVKECNHSTIVPSPNDTAVHPAFKIIKQCLSIQNTTQYTTLRNTFDTENEQLYEENKVYRKDNESVDPINRFQQFIVRVLDNMGNAVSDYRLDFHIVDNSIQRSTWTAQSPPPALDKYSDYNVRIIEKVISDVEQHSVEPSYRTFFINIDELNKLLGDLGSAHPNAYVSLNLDALPSAPGVSYNTDLIKYVGLNSSFNGKSFVKKNTSTLVEIRLQIQAFTISQRQLSQTSAN
ncbi:MAG TPA: hypothetical protein VNY06_03970 [Methylocella sp.]|nr:hypothetical protein [Methylocella sp.]